MRSWIWICYSASASCRTSRRLSRVSINSQHFASRFLPSASVPCRRRRFVENKISFWCDSTTVLGCVALISIWSNLLNFTYEFALLIRNVEVLCQGRGGIPFRIFWKTSEGIPGRLRSSWVGGCRTWLRFGFSFDRILYFRRRKSYEIRERVLDFKTILTLSEW